MADQRPRSSTPSVGDSGHIRLTKTQGRKRKRVSVACRSCRVRKSRCDGARPCSTCEDMDTECRYEQPHSQPVAITNPGSSERQEESLLEQRLQAIEKRLRLSGPDKQLDSFETHTTTSPTVRENHESRRSPGMKGPLDQDDGVDGMGAVALKDRADEEEYFGASSNVAFLRFIHAVGDPVNAVDNLPLSSIAVPTEVGQSNDDRFDAFLRRPSGISSLTESQGRVRVEPFALPPQTEADALLHLFFTTVNLMIPCIYEVSFRDTYRKLQIDGVLSVRRSWLATLNVVFALATNVMTATSPNIERAARASMYFERAMELVKSDILGRLSLEMVQLFLLMEAYLEGTTSSSLAWTLHGLAVKGAYQLGLHVMDSKSISQTDREVRRRSWYWCVMNDRFLSVTYGRPPLIPLSHVRFEASAYVPFSNVSSAVTVYSLAYFDAMISITHIMGEALERLYDSNLGLRTRLPMGESLNQISKLRWELAQWQDNLPSCLRIITSQETLDDVPLTMGTTRLRVLLSLRFLGARILILRPVLSQFLDLPGMTASSEHQSEWLRDSGAILLVDLVRTCGDILQTSKNILAGSRNDQNLLGAWWFSCYYTFNSSLAVLGVLLIKRIPAYSRQLSTISVSELRGLLETAMEVLRGLNKGSETVMRCRDTLTRLITAFNFDGNNAHPFPDYHTHITDKPTCSKCSRIRTSIILTISIQRVGVAICQPGLVQLGGIVESCSRDG
ncbi:putative Zn(II)2Cys6 transcription factor [Aspergillus campestris IBT 28561]|uniref:Zn(II)2Cys6 transcription factor n=1 Tax=Aspergillus campestris (strain IBT 28561) TaxID=1392248 RepID=A0A2I1D732_ASPC2|nr:putative Zn(II)2Cys6 transcription factor [Aspergillus campestris IBT 28561]PKY05678.1 putative Zn(II)2Cys6 transcription factor [Aspergillus campestris IBT 28561]